MFELSQYDPVVRNLIASGQAITRGIYGNQSITSEGQTFLAGIPAAASFTSVARRLEGATPTNGVVSKDVLGINRDLPYNDQIINEINKVAIKVSQIGKITISAATEFLHILITIDSVEVMTKIADATQISELANPSIINDPIAILSIPRIENVAYLADAIFAINQLYRKYSKIYSHLQGKTDETTSVSEIIDKIKQGLNVIDRLSNIGSQLGASPPVNSSGASTLFGGNLSRIVFGNEIPLAIQANNPMLTAPSVIGRMMFGEQPASTALTDINQLFARPIAVFGDVVSAAANISFLFKNAGSLSAAQPLNQLINRTLFGNGTVSPTSFAGQMLTRVQSSVQDIIGAAGNSLVEMAFADNAIPITSAISDALAQVSQHAVEITEQYREQLETITSTIDGIKSVISKGINLADAVSRQLNSLTSSVAQINIRVQNLFPISTYQNGWQQMASAQQSISRNHELYQKIIYILNNLA